MGRRAGAGAASRASCRPRAGRRRSRWSAAPTGRARRASASSSASSSPATCACAAATPTTRARPPRGAAPARPARERRRAAPRGLRVQRHPGQQEGGAGLRGPQPRPNAQTQRHPNLAPALGSVLNPVLGRARPCPARPCCQAHRPPSASHPCYPTLPAPRRAQVHAAGRGDGGRRGGRAGGRRQGRRGRGERVWLCHAGPHAHAQVVRQLRRLGQGAALQRPAAAGARAGAWRPFVVAPRGLYAERHRLPEDSVRTICSVWDRLAWRCLLQGSARLSAAWDSSY